MPMKTGPHTPEHSAKIRAALRKSEKDAAARAARRGVPGRPHTAASRATMSAVKHVDRATHPREWAVWYDYYLARHRLEETLASDLAIARAADAADACHVKGTLVASA